MRIHWLFGLCVALAASLTGLGETPADAAVKTCVAPGHPTCKISCAVPPWGGCSAGFTEDKCLTRCNKPVPAPKKKL